MSLDVPVGPFALQIPATAAPRPLFKVMNGAWSPTLVERLEQSFGNTTALCMPIPGATRPRGALLALLPEESQAVLFAGVLAHAASAAVRRLDDEAQSIADGVLPPSVFAVHASDEILRAERYQRPVSVVVLETDRLDELVQLGRELAPGLRRWDLLGRLTEERPAIAAILPETTRAGARALEEAWSSALDALQSTCPCHPDEFVV
jgi:hypothetical protein